MLGRLGWGGGQIRKWKGRRPKGRKGKRRKVEGKKADGRRGRRREVGERKEEEGDKGQEEERE